MRHKKLIATLWAFTGVTAVALGLLAWLARPNRSAAAMERDHPLLAALIPTAPTAPLPTLFDVPPFALTDQTNHPFGNENLHGKVWIVDFIFTHCTGMCPLMTQHMADVQARTAGSPVQLVSVSVDPENDTPAVLADYAAKNNADTSRWHFLTGTQLATWDLSKALKLAVAPDRGGQVFHSSRFLLVDQDGHVRGVYDSHEAGFIAKLVIDAKLLASSKGDGV